MTEALTLALRLATIRTRHRKLEGAAGRPAPLISMREKKEIEAEILSGAPFREIAARHGISVRRLNGMAGWILPELLEKHGIDRSWATPMTERACEHCGEPFQLRRSNHRQKFCSRTCSGQSTWTRRPQKARTTGMNPPKVARNSSSASDQE